MVRQKSNLVFMTVVALAFIISTVIQAAECKSVTPAEFAKLSQEWHGRTVIATASWCSSCKSKLLSAHQSPDSYVILVAFDESRAVESVLNKFEIASPCIAGDAVVKLLNIESLPWHAQI